MNSILDENSVNKECILKIEGLKSIMKLLLIFLAEKRIT